MREVKNGHGGVVLILGGHRGAWVCRIWQCCRLVAVEGWPQRDAKRGGKKEGGEGWPKRGKEEKKRGRAFVSFRAEGGNELTDFCTAETGKPQRWDFESVLSGDGTAGCEIAVR